jgi:ribosomal protein L7Ae-like RNA K-turn-binding protein
MDKTLNNLGLCMKAGYVITGEEMVTEYIKSKKVFYIFLASDAGANTKKKITDKAKFYNVDICESYSSDLLSQSIGKKGRMVVGITDLGFSKLLRK